MSELKLRCANEQDMELLFQWVNDDAVRKNSFSQQRIRWEEHVAWYQNVLKDCNEILYIGEADGVPVGQIRIQISGIKGRISYSVAEDYRHLGYGRQLLDSVVRKIRKDFPDVKTLVGEVKPDNVVSQVAFESVGFSEHHRTYHMQLDNLNE